MDLIATHYGNNSIGNCQTSTVIASTVTDSNVTNSVASINSNNNFLLVDTAIYKNFATIISTQTALNLNTVLTTTTANNNEFTVNNNNSENIYSNTFNNSTIFNDCGFATNFPTLHTYSQFPCIGATSATMFDDSAPFASNYCNLAPFGYTQYSTIGNGFSDASEYPSTLSAMSSLTSSTLTASSNLVPTTNSLFITTPCTQQNTFLPSLDYLNGATSNSWPTFTSNNSFNTNFGQNSLSFDTLKTIKNEKNKNKEIDDRLNLNNSKRKYKNKLCQNEKSIDEKCIKSKF